MPIAQMLRFVELARGSDETVPERLAILEAHDRRIEEQIARLRAHQEQIRLKIDIYRSKRRLPESGSAVSPAEAKALVDALTDPAG